MTDRPLKQFRAMKKQSKHKGRKIVRVDANNLLSVVMTKRWAVGKGIANSPFVSSVLFGVVDFDFFLGRALVLQPVAIEEPEIPEKGLVGVVGFGGGLEKFVFPVLRNRIGFDSEIPLAKLKSHRKNRERTVPRGSSFETIVGAHEPLDELTSRSERNWHRRETVR